MGNARTFKQHIAARCCDGHRECAGFDTIGQNGMHGAFEPVAALNAQDRGADALDFCAHFDETLGNVADFRLARGVFNQGFALCECSRQKHVVRRTDRHFRENDMCAAQTLRRAR